MRTYYLCFDFVPENNWRPNASLQTKIFGHAWLITDHREGGCMILDKTVEAMKFVDFPCSAEELGLELKAKGIKVFKIEVPRFKNRTIEFFTCVGFCKKALNITPFWILTPRQLWRYVNGKHTEL